MEDLDICGHKFKFITEIKPICDENGNIKAYNYIDKHKDDEFNAFGNRTFCEFSLNIPENLCGIYLLRVNGKNAYIGETYDLKMRWNKSGYGKIADKASLKNGLTTNCQVNSYIYEHASKGEKCELYFLKTAINEKYFIELLGKDLINRSKKKKN